MGGQPTWTDCDEAEDYVVPYVLSPRDLVSRPDNMDETVTHTIALVCILDERWESGFSDNLLSFQINETSNSTHQYTDIDCLRSGLPQIVSSC